VPGTGEHENESYGFVKFNNFELRVGLFCTVLCKSYINKKFSQTKSRVREKMLYSNLSRMYCC